MLDSCPADTGEGDLWTAQALHNLVPNAQAWRRNQEISSNPCTITVGMVTIAFRDLGMIWDTSAGCKGRENRDDLVE